MAEIPITFCTFCDKKVPVYIKEFEFELDGDIATGEVVVCPICINILSLDGDIEVEYYSEEDLDKVVDFKINYE